MRYSINQKYKNRKGLAIILGLCLIIAVLVFFVIGQNKTGTTKQEMINVRNKVAKLAILPTSEDPTLATVTDVNSLTDAFLKANAQNGDKILVYVKAAKVYIYRPSVNKIVNIGPLTVEASAAEIKNTKILVRQGNGNAATAKSITSKLKSSYSSATILDAGQAARQNYPTTIVIDLTDGDKYNLVTNIAQAVDGQRGVLPSGETKPSGTDILIITGLDKN